MNKTVIKYENIAGIFSYLVKILFNMIYLFTKKSS